MLNGVKYPAQDKPAMSDIDHEPAPALHAPPDSTASRESPRSPALPGSVGEGRKPRRPVTVLILSIIAMLLVVAGIAGLKVRQISEAIAMGKAFKMPPEAVTTLVVSEEEEDPVLESVGSLSSPQGVMLGADLPGTVSGIAFESGSHATNGQLLVQLDIRQEEAQLRTAAAKLDLARQNLDRARDLGEKRVIAQSALDEAKSQNDAAAASVDEIRATIARKTIRAPFDGELGIRQVNVGQYLKSGDPIIQLEALDPIYVNFALPQQNLGTLSPGQRVRLMADGLPDRIFEGRITAINSAVDTATRNIQVQATVPNPSHLLRSGMFGGVEVRLPGKGKIVMIPSTSVQYAPYGNSVFVLETLKDAEGKEYLGVREQRVELGRNRGDQVTVLSGLKPGERIATSGTFKLRQGVAVKVVDTVQPGNNPAPKPADS